MNLMKALVSMVVGAMMLAACGGSDSASPDLTRAAVGEAMSAEGFVGGESRLTERTPRWLGNGPRGSILEIVGPEESPTAATLTTGPAPEDGELMELFLDTWARGSFSYLQETLRYPVRGPVDEVHMVGERSVRFRAFTQGDDFLIAVFIHYALQRLQLLSFDHPALAVHFNAFFAILHNLLL